MMDVEQDEPDGATKAFTEVRDKLAGLTRAVDSMAGEWKALAIPDYSATLEKLARATQANASHIEVMSDRPGLKLTPETLSDAIIKAGSASRAADHAALANATIAFQTAEQTIVKSLASARTLNEQDKRLKKVGMNCLIAGMIICSIFPGPIIRALPSSWHLPERLAARAIGTNAWDAGEKLMAFDSPDQWDRLSLIANAIQNNRHAVDTCLRALSKSRQKVRCAINFELDGRAGG